MANDLDSRSETQEIVKRIPDKNVPAMGIAPYYDPANLPAGYFAEATNVKISRGAIWTREGCTYHSDYSSATTALIETGAITALYFFKGRTGGNTEKFYCWQEHDIDLVTAGASPLKVWDTANTTWISLKLPSSITTANYTAAGQFYSYNNKCYFTNGADPILVLQPLAPSTASESAVQTAGVESPDVQKIICDCENENYWTAQTTAGVGIGTSTANVFKDEVAIHRVRGDSSVKLEIYTANKTVCFTYLITALLTAGLDLKTFENGETASDSNEYIAFSLYRNKHNKFKKVFLEFDIDSSGWTNYFSCPVYHKEDSENIVRKKDMTEDIPIIPIIPDDNIMGIPQEPYIGEFKGQPEMVETVQEDPHQGYGFWIKQGNAPSSSAWEEIEHDNILFQLRLRKKWFISQGTVTTAANTGWSTISKMRLNIISTTASNDISSTDPAMISIDNFRLLKSPPVPRKAGISVAEFTPFIESWQIDGSAVSTNKLFWSAQYATREGGYALKVASGDSALLTYGSSENMQLLNTGDSDTNPYFKMDYQFKSGLTAGTITVGFKDSANALVGSEDFIIAAGNVAGQRTLESLQSNFTGGNDAWTDVKYFFIDHNGYTQTLYYDNARFEGKDYQLWVDPFEWLDNRIENTSEDFETTITFPKGANVPSGNNYYATYMPGSYIVNNYMDVETGTKEWMLAPEENISTRFGEIEYESTQALWLRPTSSNDGDEGKYTFDYLTNINLGTYETGVTALGSDQFKISLAFKKVSAIQYIKFILYTGTVGGSNYVEHKITNAALAGKITKKEKRSYFEWRRDSMLETGTMDWTAVSGYRIEIKPTKPSESSDRWVGLDNWMLKRGRNLTGTYWYKIRMMDEDGWPSAASEESMRVETEGTEVYLSSIYSPEKSTVGYGLPAYKELYRKGGTISTYNFISMLEVGQDDYVDNTSDEYVGQALESDFYPPPKAKTACLIDDVVYYGNIINRHGKYYPCRIMKSQPFAPHLVSDFSVIRVNEDDGGQIVAIREFWRNIYVFKNNGTYILDPQTERPQLINSVHGCIARDSIAEWNERVIFLSRRGIIQFSGYDFNTELGKPVMTEFTSYVNSGLLAYLTKAVGFVYNDFYYIFYGRYNEKGLCCYLPENKWTRISNFDTSVDATVAVTQQKALTVRSVALFDSIFRTAGDTYYGLYTGRNYGYVDRTFYSHFDYSAAISSSIALGDDDFGFPERDKQIKKIFMQGRSISTSASAAFTLRYYINETAVGTAMTADLTSTAIATWSQDVQAYKGAGKIKLQIDAKGRYKITGLQQVLDIYPITWQYSP